MKFNKYWFKPKTYGYGATPTSWEGWAVIAVFLAYLLYISTLITDGNTVEYISYLVAGIIVMIIISKKKMEGEMKWNWGKK